MIKQKCGDGCKESKPFISIAIASYNYESCLRRGFEAVCRQRFKDFELVYLDDASTDNSVELIKEFIEQHPDMNIRLIENKNNKGILYSKTRLLRECRGEYVMLCDADDWMGDDCLQKLAAAARKENADRVVSEVVNIGADGRTIQIQKLPAEPSEWLWNIHHGCLYRRSIAIENDISIEYEPDDVYFITMFNLYCRKTAWIHEPLYYWYVHKDSSGRATGVNDIGSMTDRFEDMMKYIRYAGEKCQDSRSREFLEILAMKLYYLQLFHSMRYYSLSDKLTGYSELRGVMGRYFPEYIKGRYRLLSKKYLRDYAYYIISLSRLIEKIHLMRPALAAYHLIGKFIYIDQ